MSKMFNAIKWLFMMPCKLTYRAGYIWGTMSNPERASFKSAIIWLYLLLSPVWWAYESCADERERNREYERRYSNKTSHITAKPATNTPLQCVAEIPSKF